MHRREIFTVFTHREKPHVHQATMFQGLNELFTAFQCYKFGNLMDGFWLNNMDVFILLEQRQGEPLFLLEEVDQH